MRLVDVTDSYHPRGGGIRTYIDEKIRFLRDTEHEHVLVVPAARDGEERHGSTRVVSLASPVIPGCAPYRVLARPGLGRLLDRLDPDVIELGNAYFHPRLARGLLRRDARLLAGFYHTDFPRAYAETPLRRIAGRPAGRWAVRAAVRYARHVHRGLDLTLTASPALERKLRRLGVPGVALVPLGVDTRTFHPERRDPALRRELGLGENDRLLVYAGRIDAEKRVDVLLDMTRCFPAGFPWKLLILGDGPQRATVEKAAGADPRILHLPFEPDRLRLAGILASADCYVSAARFETFGLSVLEAQACGLPVVGQRAGAMIERVPAGTGLLVDDLDPRLMADAVVAVFRKDPTAMGRAARALVEARHGWDRTFTRLLHLYEDALAERGRRAAPAA